MRKKYQSDEDKDYTPEDMLDAYSKVETAAIQAGVALLPMDITGVANAVGYDADIMDYVDYIIKYYGPNGA